MVRADFVPAANVAALGVDGAPALAGDASRTTHLTRADWVYRYNSFHPIAAKFPSATLSVYGTRLGLRFEF